MFFARWETVREGGVGMKKLDNFIFTGSLKGGKVIPRNPRYVKGSLQMYDDCDIRVVVEQRRRSKTKEQLGYLYGVVYPEISRYTGHTVLELDLLMKHKFLKKKVLWRGLDMLVSGSKAPLTSNELAEFIQSVILEANELGIVVPPPDKLIVVKKTLMTNGVT